MRGKSTAIGSVVVGVVLACAVSQNLAGEEPMPTEDLLEFLGNWEEGDQDWLTIALEMVQTEDAGGSEDTNGSAEKDDEDK